MESKGVVVGRRVFVVVARDGVDNERDESGEECGEENRADSPYEDLAADDDAAKIYILLLLLFARAEEPTLLRLVQGPRQRRPVEVLQVPAAVLLRGRVRGIDLQRTTPGISTVHYRFFCFLESNNATDTTHSFSLLWLCSVLVDSFVLLSFFFFYIFSFLLFYFPESFFNNYSSSPSNNY